MSSALGVKHPLFEKAAPSQKPGGYGTGRQWRPLDQALDVLWQAGACTRWPGPCRCRCACTATRHERRSRRPLACCPTTPWGGGGEQQATWAGTWSTLAA